MDIKQKNIIYHPVIVAMQLFFLYAWISNLPGTDSFFSVYAFYAVAGSFCLFDNCSRKPEILKGTFRAICCFSVCFSLSVILANYRLFEPLTALMSLFNMGLCFVGGCIIGFHFFLWIWNHIPLKADPSQRMHEKLVFGVTFAGVVLVDLLYLFSTNYPAVVSVDSLAQFNQILGFAPYSNWTPYWHTVTVGFFFRIGYMLFGDVNAALVVYEVCQISFVAVCFSYVLTTLYQMGLPKSFLYVTYYLYVLYPYNIVFNVTVGKDVLFGMGLLIMMTALLRIILGIGKRPILNDISLVIGGCGFSLWRTNGFYITLLMTIVLLLIFRGRKKRLLGLMCGVLAICGFLVGPYLDVKGVEQAPFTETMAIPFQQIGRVIVNERTMSSEEEAFLSELFHFDEVLEFYRPESADPMKFDAFRHKKMGFLEENLETFLRIWIQLGLRYPGDYLFAWIDATRGYWNGGYNTGVYDQGIPGNTLGMYNSGGDNVLSGLFDAYFRYIEDPAILAPLKSIGFVVWLVLACWWVNVLKKRHIAVLSVPVLILLAGLWLGTPVFAEFRYAYPVFLVSPLIILTTMFSSKQEALSKEL